MRLYSNWGAPIFAISSCRSFSLGLSVGRICHQWAQMAMHSIGRFVPQQLEPVSTPPVDGDGEQCLADEIEQGAGLVDRQQDAEDPQNREWLLVQVLQVEQPDPEQFLGCGVVGDEVYGERGLRDPVDDAAVEGDAVEQQEHAEADHHHGEFPISGDEDSLVDAEQSQNG